MMVSSTNDPVRVQCRNSRTPPGAPRGRSVRGKARADQHVSPLFPELGLLAEHSLLDEARLARDSARSQVVRLEVQLHPLDAQLGKGVVAGEANGATGEGSSAVPREDDVGHFADPRLPQPDLALAYQARPLRPP